MDLRWDPEEDIAVYFIKLHKEQERLKDGQNQLVWITKGYTVSGRDVFKSTV